MAFDAYSPCPCGSGKKFKWCCQPIYAQIEKALQQDAEGQHEAALRILDEAIAANPANPEAWGRKAQLLSQHGRMDEAENALQKAFDINPSYPFGLLLRGLFRQGEGEIAGALLLFRKAAEAYDPQARDQLAEIYALIGNAELQLHRPLAARAAFQVCMRVHPSDDLAKQLDQVFGSESHFPEAARRDYIFQSPPADAPAEVRAAWDRALKGSATGKLADAVQAFETLTRERPQDGPAWYNLGLVRAWLGDNAAALEALDHHVTLETNEQRAAAAWAMAEVLRFGQGMEDQADYVEHSALMQIRDPRSFFGFLDTWQRERRLVGVQVRQEEGTVSGVVLDRSGLVTAAGANTQPAKLGAYLVILGDLLILRSTLADALDRIRREVQERAGPHLSEARLQRGPANFTDVLADVLIFPLGSPSKEETARLVREHVQRYFEETWIHRPLVSLGRVPPVDAAGHSTLRKKLLGVVQFLEECARSGGQPYDFDRLRRKLGLSTAPGPGALPVEERPAQAPLDLSAMSAAELAALEPETLGEEQVDEAYRAAQKLDAQELAVRFARNLVARPPRQDRADRFPWYTYLVQRALAAGDTDTALQYVDEGEKADCETNEGRRRNDYELRRGQVLAKRGDADSAREVFERLVARAPDELRYQGTAAESMLSARQGRAALQFAEQGLTRAREKNDRDSEQYFMELVSAAKRQVS
jgi:tetratricopeptide (TPR) repeat protein